MKSAAKDDKIKGEPTEIDSYAQIQKIKDEDTQLLKNIYEMKHEEGLDKFDSSLTKFEEFESRIAQS